MVADIQRCAAVALLTTAIRWTLLGVSAGAAAGDVGFVDVASESGVDFTHVNGMTGEVWLLEIMGAGVGLLDFDGDGRLDIWLVQGGPIASRSGPLPCDRLYRNASDGGELRFIDVTATAGVCSDGYGMGIATGDIDGDGDLDVFIANYGPNRLFENLGDGRFRNITADAGVAGDDWSVSASFADFDGDGWADLYVANYVDFSVAKRKRCTGAHGEPSYCSPEVYEPSADLLYRNLGNGTFADVSAAAGIGAAQGAALGVVAEDFNGDGHVDFYVANDMTDNFLWLNQGDGRFRDDALLAGVAVNADGMVEASMGVAAADFDADCDVDLFMTHLAVQTNTLYVNDGRGWFTDRSNATGVAAGSIPHTGFGTGWFDADNDGDLDVFSANGAVSAIAGQSPGPLELPLRQPNQLWINDGKGRYREVRVHAFAVPEVSRGAAFGDLDNDGDVDIAVTNNRGHARLYRNQASENTTAGHWLGIELEDAENRPLLGSTVWMEPNRCRAQRYSTDGSYAAAHDPRLLFGAGTDSTPKHVTVRWPDGATETFGPLPANRYHVLKRTSRETNR